MQIVLRVEIKCVKVKLTCEEGKQRNTGRNKRHRQAKEENKRLREK